MTSALIFSATFDLQKCVLLLELKNYLVCLISASDGVAGRGKREGRSREVTVWRGRGREEKGGTLGNEKK